MMRRLLAAVGLLLALPAGASEVVLRATTFEAWDRQRAAYRPDIVVVDMWATWCTSCIERFPKMVELHQRYGDQGVQFVSMLLEDPEDTDAIELARGFLERTGATFDNWFMNENLMASFERLDLIGLPAVLIYDGKGRLTHRLTGDDPNDQFDDEDVEQAVQSLLASSAP